MCFTYKFYVQGTLENIFAYQFSYDIKRKHHCSSRRIEAKALVFDESVLIKGNYFCCRQHLVVDNYDFPVCGLVIDNYDNRVVYSKYSGFII